MKSKAIKKIAKKYKINESTIDKMFKDIKREQEQIVKDHNKFQLLSDIQFKSLVLNENIKHDKKWTKSCHDRGYEPYPRKSLQRIFNVFEYFGTNVYTNEQFAWMCKYYKGLTFTLYMGQGSYCRITENKKLILEI
jgi:hypothetical protein